MVNVSHFSSFLAGHRHFVLPHHMDCGIHTLKSRIAPPPLLAPPPTVAVGLVNIEEMADVQGVEEVDLEEDGDLEKEL